MNSLQKTFLSMIKTTLWDMPFVCEDKVTASDLFQEACRYEIAGVLSTKLDEFCQDDIVTRSKWSKKAMNDYQKSSFILSAQAALCEILSKENIRPVFVKGMASAFYYPDPLLRQIGDIDFLVLPDQFETCCRILEQNGYKKGTDNKRHIEFEKQGITYECHRHFTFNVTDKDKREDQIIYQGCRNCTTRIVESKEFYSLPDVEHGIVLLEHLKIHLAGGVGFRQIMDWVVYVDAVLDDNLWNCTFQKKACECELEQLAKAVTKTSQVYLGLKYENISWCDDVDESLCEVLIGLLFSSNNFGFIEKEKCIRIADTVLRGGFFSNLNYSACAHFPITKKIVILRPFAWLYQLIRWGIRGTKSIFHSNKHVASSVKTWQDQKEMLRQIGVLM